jgi:hypothetical protein
LLSATSSSTSIGPGGEHGALDLVLAERDEVVGRDRVRLVDRPFQPWSRSVACGSTAGPPTAAMNIASGFAPISLSDWPVTLWSVRA